MQNEVKKLKLNQSLVSLQFGETDTAIKELKEILKEVPIYDEALYFLALGLYKKGILEEAAINIEKAVQLNPDPLYIKDACDIFFDFALSYSDKNDLDNAIKYYKKCLLLNPEDKDAICNLGQCYFDKNDLESAARYFLILTQLDLTNKEAYIKLTKVYEYQSNFDKALNTIKKAIELDPSNPQLLCKAGMISSAQKEYGLAVNYFYKSHQLNPKDAKTCYNIGLALYNDYKKTESISWYEHAIELNTQFYEAYLNLGLALCSAGRYEESLQSFDKALKLRPDSVEVYMNMGVSHFYNLDDNSAENCYNKAYEIDPENVEAIIGQGFLHQFRNESEQAEEFYKKVLEKDSEHPYANFNMSNIHLLRGNFKKGWKLYEYRFKLNSFTRPYIPRLKQQMWQGGSLAGKTLYIYPEQGFGDALQLSRFFPKLAALGEKVIFKAKQPLMQLFRENNLGIELVEETVPESDLTFDYYVPLMSLLGILDIDTKNIPSSKGYLRPSKELVQRYKEKYFNNNYYKVGIFWSGNQKGLINRMLQLEKLLSLTKIKGVKVYSFQKGPGIEQLDTISSDIVDIGSTFNSFADTAAAMENLDVMVSPDTAVAHLAGAISKETLLLLPYASEWRWLQDIDCTPWYDSIRLIRQKELKNWDSVIEQLCQIIKGRNKNSLF